MSARFRGTELHLPYGITECYLPPDTGERASPQPQPDRLVLDLLAPEGWKAELIRMVGYMPRRFILSADSILNY